jgi:hypothetical protein
VEVSQAVRDSILQLGAKRVMLQDMKDSLETIVLGSSHGDYAFDPAALPGSFNLCYRSLDLKHCYYLYRRVIELCPDLKNIVLFYSVFSPGSVLERSPTDSDIGPLFSALFELDVEYQADNLNALAKALTRQLQDGMAATLAQEAAQLDGRAGFLPAYKGVAPAAEFDRRLLSHIKLNYESGADYYLLKILAIANNLGHNVHIVIPPVTAMYRKAVGARSSIIFRELIEVVGSFPWRVPVKVMNCYDDESYTDAFFVDSDHMDARGEGTRMLSQAIADQVRATEAAA